MVHGQAIGIPFRRRKGEQAPPPPKEVAWNPTIESNLPYKEVKYLKFVEGAGWQALNIGEILPVGQRVMIRIVMTEPYYEVSKAVSSQMTGIQIGKNGESEYDIVGALTVYSPQILTVTIGVDKNYVQWNPVVESNAPYKSIRYYKLSDSGVGYNMINIGDYIPIGRMIMITIDTVNSVDELVSAVSSQLTGIGINGSNGTYNITGALTSESPQNINITIDEYIRYEDIVQPYPSLVKLENVDRTYTYTWGDKLKVGDTIRYNSSVNLLNGAYTLRGQLECNGVYVFDNNQQIVVTKEMVFAWSHSPVWSIDNNEPKVILSPNRLRIPNSSYKILGHIPDISGHGNHGVIHNSAYALNSGVNGYTEDFTKWTLYTGVKCTDSTISLDSSFNKQDQWILFKPKGSNINQFTINIKGIPNGGNLYLRLSTDSNIKLENGINEISSYTNVTNSTGFFIGANGLNLDWSNLIIEQVGEYEGAYCLDGVDDFITIPTTVGGKQVLMKVNWQRGIGQGMLYDQRGTAFAIWNSDKYNDDETDTIPAYSARNGGNTYIDGILNKNILASQLRNITHNIVATNTMLNGSSVSPTIGCRTEHDAYFTNMSLYDFMLFDEISTDEEILTLNEYVGIEGNTDDLFTENN